MGILTRQEINIPLDELEGVEKTFSRVASLDLSDVSAQMTDSYEMSRLIAYRHYTLSAIFKSFRIEFSHSNNFTIESGDTLSLGDIGDLFVDSFDLGLLVVSLKEPEITMSNDDMLYELFMDAWGTAFVGSGEKWLTGYIRKQVQDLGLHMTNPFGPGQGSIPLEMQAIILNNLNASQIGVSLNSRFVMSPKKTVTGIFGIQRKPLTDLIKACDLCNLSGGCPTAYA